MSNKKKLSIAVNKILDRELKNSLGLFTIKAKEGYEVYISDIDEMSSFHFAIIKETYDTNGHYIHVSWQPQSATKKTSSSTSVKIEHFETRLKEWLENIKYYNQPSILDDNILNGYQQEFYSEYKIVDEDADINPFTYDQQIGLLRFLDTITANIDEIKDDSNADSIEEIKAKSEILKEIVTKETKNSFMQQLGRVFAVARKAGFKTSNFVFKEFIKEFIKEGAKWSFNFAVRNTDKLPEYIKTITESIKQLPG